MGVWLGGLVAAALAAAGCSSTGQEARPPAGGEPGGLTVLTTTPPTPEPAQPGERRPQRVSFLTRADSCERFVESARRVGVEAVGPFGFDGGYGVALGGRGAAAAPGGSRRAAVAEAASAPGGAGSAGGAGGAVAPPAAGVDFSATNVQEAGVDEPDVAKTDGRLLITATDGRLRVLDVSGAPRLVGQLDLPNGVGELLLVGTRALVISSSANEGPVGMAQERAGVSPERRPTTVVTVVDLADPARPTIARSHTIDGGYVDARLVGGVARIVTRSTPDITFPRPATQPEVERAQAANAEVVRTAPASAFLPKGASCADAYVPSEGSGVGTVAVQSVDPAAAAPGPAVTVVADASTVYASAGRLFVATNRFGGGGPVRSATTGTAPGPGSDRTAIHAFDITDPAKARYAGSGDVPGRLLNQFSLSEHAGVLRVATTTDATSRVVPADGAQQGLSQSRVSVLRPAGDEWVEAGAVDGLGKGERIYAVRFLGDAAYVVTFRQTDPLYVLDLREPRRPTVTGELKITGYSAYLHPAGDHRLLGIGQEASEEGRRVGTQLSLFDVGDPTAPAKLAGAVLPSASSSAEQDHHAFLYWPASGLVVAPIQSYAPQGATPPFVGAVVFRVGDKSVTEAGRITHPGSTPIQRSMVVGSRLLTLSPVGLAVNDLKTLADGGFVAFR